MGQKVYCVMLSIPFEGSELEAVFSSKKAAEQFAKEQQASNRCSFVTYSVTEMEVRE